LRISLADLAAHNSPDEVLGKDRYQLEVPFVDAMHLLALLQGAKDDVGYKEPVEAPPPEKD
jgi:hypothetical protein